MSAKMSFHRILIKAKALRKRLLSFENALLFKVGLPAFYDRHREQALVNLRVQVEDFAHLLVGISCRCERAVALLPQELASPDEGLYSFSVLQEYGEAI